MFLGFFFWGGRDTYKTLNYYQSRKEIPVIQGNKNQITILVQDKGKQTFPVSELVSITYCEEVDGDPDGRHIKKFFRFAFTNHREIIINDTIYGDYQKETYLETLKTFYPHIPIEKNRYSR